jgi:trans-2,3-dihydro-3-hydroxyanthranilate isomerase
VIGINLYAVVTAGDPLQISARVFVPGPAMPEDPATGSAAVGLGIALVDGGLAGQGSTRYQISQGVELGRPSVLHGRVEATDGRASRCFVAGQVVSVGSGSIAVPSV